MSLFDIFLCQNECRHPNKKVQFINPLGIRLIYFWHVGIIQTTLCQIMFKYVTRQEFYKETKNFINVLPQRWRGLVNKSIETSKMFQLSLNLKKREHICPKKIGNPWNINQMILFFVLCTPSKRKVLELNVFSRQKQNF